MPRFFFDILNNGDRAKDAFGVDLADMGEARENAISLLPDIARDELPDGERHEFVCEVRSEANRIVYRARLLLLAGAVDEPTSLGDGRG